MKNIFYKLKNTLSEKQTPKIIFFSAFICISLGICLSLSYAIFSTKIEKSGRLNIIVGEIQYSISSLALDNNNSIILPANSGKKISLSITSNNTKSSMYEIFYKVTKPEVIPEGLEIGYLEESPSPVVGTIGTGETKTVILSLKNQTNDEITVIFGVQGGLPNRSLTLDSGGISINKLIEPTAKIDTVFFASLQDAVDAVSSTSTEVILLRDIRENISLSSSKNVLLNLGTKTLSGSIQNAGKLALKNGTLTNDTVTLINNLAGADLQLIDATLVKTNTKTNAVNNLGSMNMLGGKINASHYGINNNGTLLISGGEVEASQIALYNSNGNLTVSGGNITSLSSGTVTVYQKEGGKTNVTGGKVVATNGNAFYIINGNLDISNNAEIVQLGTSYNSIANEGGTTIKISGGTFISQCGVIQAGGNVTITGGSFTTNKSTAIWNRGGIIDVSNAIFNGTESIFNLDGGSTTIRDSSITRLGSSTAVAVDNSGGILKLHNVNANISMGNTTTYAFVNAAQMEITGNNVFVFEGCGFKANAESILTISSGIFTSSNKAIYSSGTNSRVIINGGEFIYKEVSTKPLYFVYAGAGGTIQMNGGTINDNAASLSSGFIRLASSGTLDFNNGNLKTSGGIFLYNSSGIVNIKGGLLAATGTTVNPIYNTGTLNISGGTITDTPTQYFIINNTGITNISANANIQVSTGIAGTSGIITVSGGFISSSDYSVFESRGMTVNITGGTIKGSRVINLVSGNLNISGGDFTTTSYSINNTGGQAVISGGTFNSASYVIYNSGSTTKTRVEGTSKLISSGNRVAYNLANSTLEIAGGTLETTTGYGVYNNGNLNISGGTIKTSSATYHAIYNSSTGIISMTNGTVQQTSGVASKYAIYNASGTVTKTGGTTTPSNYGM